MKPKFKPGDRVAVYGIGDDYGWFERLIGTVRTIQDNPPRLFVEVSGTRQDVTAMPQQCRRLKPKRKAREFWIEISEDGYVRWGKDHNFVGHDEHEMVHVREVLPKRGSK